MMNPVNIVRYGTYISRLNDYEDVYELDGVQYAVGCEWCENLNEDRYWAKQI